MQLLRKANAVESHFFHPLLAICCVILSGFLILLSSPNYAFAQTEGGARCYCVNPEADGCSCLVTGESTQGSQRTSEGGVELICDNSIVAGSYWSRINPICGTNAETIPSCARVGGQDAMCWGSIWGIQISPASVPTNSNGWVPVNANVRFGGWAGYVQNIWTCAADLYCCGSDVCGGDGVIAYGTCPSSGPPLPETPAAAACEGMAVGNFAGIGESRLWFSQDRLVSTLSSMAQTMFNPYGLNRLYENTAFSKNATQEERDTTESYGIWPFDRDVETSGRIDNKGSITTRIEKHQGKDDDTIVVNTTTNNSSVIVGFAAPPPLNPYYEDFQDRACYVPETFTNPGDDLIGPKIKGEMLFTQMFTYPAKGQPQSSSDLKIGGGSCTRDDGGFEIPYENQYEYDDEEGIWDCCAGAGKYDVDIWERENCRQLDLLLGGTCSDSEYHCTDGNDTYCCDEPDGACRPPETVTVTCGALGRQTIPVGADANVFDKTPIIESVYNVILNDTDSLFRRFMPLPDNKRYDFDDIPTKSPFSASVSVAPFGTDAGGSFRLDFAQGQVPAPEVYFPHLGTLHKYWLVDFQKALKPEGGVLEYVDTGDLPDIGGGGCNEFNCGIILGYDTFEEGLLCAARTLSADKSKGLAQMIEEYGSWCDHEAYNTSSSINPLPFGYNLIANFYDLYTDEPRSCSASPPSKTEVLAAHDPNSPSYNSDLAGDWNVVCPYIENDPQGLRKPGNPSYDYYRGALETCSLTSSELGWAGRNIESVYQSICESGTNIFYPIAGQLNTPYNCDGGSGSRVYQVLQTAQSQNINPWLLMGVWATESVWGQIQSCMQ